MENHDPPKPEDDGRLKIPLRFAPGLKLDKSHLVRVNQGARKLSLDSAALAVDLFKKEGKQVTIYQILPHLLKFKPYFCQGSSKQGKKDRSPS